MKKVFSITLGLLLTLSMLAGCNKTPDSPIVVGKDNDQMLNAASGNEEEKKNVAEMLNVPERMVLSVTDEKGDVSADADADILLPDTDRIPTLRVRARDFTQEEADRVLAYFIGDAAFNDRFAAGYDAEQEKLMKWIEELAKETDPAKRESIQRSIDKFKSSGVEVPDIPQEVLPASKAFEQMEQGASEIKGYAQDGDNNKYLIISNNLAESKNTLLYTCEQKGYADWGQEGSYEISTRDLEELGLAAAEQLPLTLSTEDAKSKAEEAIKALNISDMEFYSCEEVWGGVTLHGGIVEQQEHHAYRLQFVRSVGGALLTYAANKIDSSTVQIDDRTGERLTASWPYERITFIIDDTGIVEFLWESPYEVTEQVVENTKLMPFEDIQGIFSKMILVTNVQYGDDKLTFHIKQAQLGMMRIQEENNPGTGLIVPVWDFFGTLTREGNELATHESYLTINAIDGSIIDRMLGF